MLFSIPYPFSPFNKRSIHSHLSEHASKFPSAWLKHGKQYDWNCNLPELHHMIWFMQYHYSQVIFTHVLFFSLLPIVLGLYFKPLIITFIIVYEYGYSFQLWILDFCVCSLKQCICQHNTVISRNHIFWLSSDCQLTSYIRLLLLLINWIIIFHYSILQYHWKLIQNNLDVIWSLSIH